MPIYEYQCSACHHTCDILQKINDKPTSKCPVCFQESLVRLVSAAAFQLKGTGWYVTDYKNKETSTSSASADHKKTPPAAASQPKDSA